MSGGSSSSSSGGSRTLGAGKQRLFTSSPLLQPAFRAFLVGYLLDALPSIFKQLLRFSLINGKRLARIRTRIQQEAKAKSDEASSAASAIGIVIDADALSTSTSSRTYVSPTSLYDDGVLPILKQLPALLRAVLKTALVALGPRGTALTCALAISGMTVLDKTLVSTLGLQQALRREAYGPRRSVRALVVGSTFLSAAASSFLALLMVQHVAATSTPSSGPSSTFSSASLSQMKPTTAAANSTKATSFFNPFRRKDTTESNLQLPTPLAPGGHFLARLTTFSVPATPKETDESQSPNLSGAKDLSPLEAKKDPLTALANSSPSFPHSVSQSPIRAQKDPQGATSELASPTIDLTLFALVRAMDTLVRAAPLLVARSKYSRHAQSSLSEVSATLPLGPSAGMRSETTRHQSRGSLAKGKGNVATQLMSTLISQFGHHAEGLTFVVACSVIMFSWFYTPERLPPSYVKWITNLANMDNRLLLALRSLRKGKPYNWMYGNPIDPTSVDLLGSLSESLGYPYGWGDPSRIPETRQEARHLKAQALAKARANGSTEVDFVLEGAAGLRGRGEMAGIPCELVHCGVGGASCYLNALYRWLRAWKVCMGIYVPVHLLPRLIFDPKQFAREPAAAIAKVLKGSMRSASFLSTFIASIWYVICNWG